MESHILGILEISLAAGVIGMISAVYLTVFHCARDTTASPKNNDTQHIISTLQSIITAEFNELKNISSNDNPYDIFTKMYPRIKDMSNDQITELVDLIDTYNSNWINNDD